MTKFSFFCACLVISSVTFAAEEIRISAGAVALNNIFSNIKEPFEKRTGIKITFVQDNPKGTNVRGMLLDMSAKKAEVIIVPNSFEDTVATAKKENIPLSTNDLKFKIIGKDLIQVITNKDAKVKSLSLDQIRDIYLNKTKNFKEVGGADQKIVLHYAEKLHGTEVFVQKNLLKGENFFKGEGTVTLPPTEAAERIVPAVAKTPGAFAAAPIGVVKDDVTSVQHEAIGRPVTMLWYGKPSSKIQKLTSFIIDEGPKLGIK